MTCSCRLDHAAVSRRLRSAMSSIGLQQKRSWWCPRLYSQLDSGQGYTCWPQVWDNEVQCRIYLALYCMLLNVVANFYKVQYEHIKLRCGLLSVCVCFKFPKVWFYQEWAKLDDVWLSYHKYLKSDVFSRSYCYTVRSAIGIILLSVCLSVCLWGCALWLSGLVYGAKSYTSVLLASMFLFVPFDTFAVGCIV